MNSVQAVMAHVSRQFESNASGLQERPESRAAEQPQPCRSYARTGRPESALPRHSGFAAQPEKSGQLAKWLSAPCTYDGSPLNGPDRSWGDVSFSVASAGPDRLNPKKRCPFQFVPVIALATCERLR